MAEVIQKMWGVLGISRMAEHHEYDRDGTETIKRRDTAWHVGHEG